MKILWRWVRILLAIGACVLAGVWLSDVQQNRPYNLTRDYTLARIQQRGDENPDGKSWQGFRRSQTMSGQIYVVEGKEDLSKVKAVLAKTKPLYDVFEYEANNVYVIVGGVDIGYAGDRQYFFETMDGDDTVLGFTLSEEQDEALWALLRALPTDI